MAGTISIMPNLQVYPISSAERSQQSIQHAEQTKGSINKDDAVYDGQLLSADLGFKK